MVLRGLLEICALFTTLLPALIVLRVWNSLPDEIPVKFHLSGYPGLWGSRARIWIGPAVCAGGYALFSVCTGTWGWLMGSPAGALLPAAWTAVLTVEKPLIGLLTGYLVSMTARIARREAEAVNPWLYCASILLIVQMAPLTFVLIQTLTAR